MDQQDVEQKIEELVRRDPRYRHDAYPFVANAVTFTVGRLPKHRHVSALELLHGVRDYAQKEFGVSRCWTSGASMKPPMSAASSIR